MLLLFAISTATQSVRSALFIEKGGMFDRFCQDFVQSARSLSREVLNVAVPAANLLRALLVYMLLPARG